MGVLNFIINEIFNQGAIFLALIACIGLILQKKSFSEIVRGTLTTAIGFYILSCGTGLITGNSIDGISAAFNAVTPSAVASKTVDIGAEFGTQIGIVMIIAFAVNVLVARFTKWKSIFLTGHMLYWFPFVFIAAGVDAGLTGGKLIGLATLFGNKEHSTEDLNVPKSLGFLREISITGSITIAITYIVLYFILVANGKDPGTVWGYAGGTTGIFTYIFTHAIYFGVGITVMLQGVRMMIAEIVPAFKGIADKIVPNAIPALDVPVIFPYAPNALLIGFIVAMITSIITLLLTSGMFPTVVIPLISTCFFETGCAAIIGNAKGGVRGCIIGAAACGIVMVFLVGFGAYFFNNTIQQWMLVYGGQDFSLWGIVEGFIARLIA